MRCPRLGSRRGDAVLQVAGSAKGFRAVARGARLLLAERLARVARHEVGRVVAPGRCAFVTARALALLVAARAVQSARGGRRLVAIEEARFVHDDPRHRWPAYAAWCRRRKLRDDPRRLIAGVTGLADGLRVAVRAARDRLRRGCAMGRLPTGISMRRGSRRCTARRATRERAARSAARNRQWELSDYARRALAGV